jgi:hypothetical protein
MKKSKNSEYGITLILTVLFLILLVGCQNQTPLSPLSEDPLQKIDVTEEYGFNILKSNTQSLAKEYTAKKWIGKEGGVIEVGDWWHGISSLKFYEGSVNEYVLVTFWWESTGFLEGGCEFSPHGIQFDKPVRVELSYKDADLGDVNEDDLKIFYYHEDTGEWEALDSTVNKWKKTVTAYLEHFSRYAIGEIS